MSAPADLDAARRSIEAAIPHRAPFLFVDRVVERFPDGLLATWRVPREADWLRGHFPGAPVLPGVLLCEHLFQCGALFVSELCGGFGATDGLPVLTRLTEARFRRLVKPDETVDTRVVLEERTGPAFVFAGTCAVGGRDALRARFVLAATGALARAVEGTA